MLREVGHLLRIAPGVLRLRARLPQAALYQEVMRLTDEAGLADARHALVADLRGEILELGSGTGNMFGHYGASAHVHAVEPDEGFAALATDAARAARARITLHAGRGEALPFPDGRFDAAVIVLVLCSVDAVDAVLAEVRRVLRPGGELRLIEHVRSERRFAGWCMDRLDRPWLALNAQGCHMNRDPLPALVAAGFAIERVEPFQVFSAGLPAFPMRAIHARRAAGS